MEDRKQLRESYYDHLSEAGSDFEEDENYYSDEDETDIYPFRGYLPLIKIQCVDPEIENECSSESTPSWSKANVRPKLEAFMGQPGVKILPHSVDSIKDTVGLFIGDDFFDLMTEETNRYHYQIANSNKSESSDSLKWVDVTVLEMKKFLGLNLLMTQVRTNACYQYWSTNPLLNIPYFRKAMSQERFYQIWESWHFCNNESISDGSNRLAKIKPILDYFLPKFRATYAPKQQLLLEESIIPWRKELAFKTYNPHQLVKYGILIRAVKEVTSGYTCNFEVYTDNDKLPENILSVVEPYNNLWHHIYQDNSYNTVNITETLFQLKFRVCGTIRGSGGLPDCLKDPELKRNQTIFRSRKHTLLQVWNDGERNVSMISNIHDNQMGDSDKHDQMRMGIFKKPNCVLGLEKSMKEGGRANKYLSHFHIARSQKWTKKAVIFFLNMALFNAFCVYKKIGTNKEICKDYTKFLLEVTTLWLDESSGPSSETEDDHEDDDEVMKTLQLEMSNAVQNQLHVQPSSCSTS